MLVLLAKSARSINSGQNEMLEQEKWNCVVKSHGNSKSKNYFISIDFIIIIMTIIR